VSRLTIKRKILVPAEKRHRVARPTSLLPIQWMTLVKKVEVNSELDSALRVMMKAHDRNSVWQNFVLKVMSSAAGESPRRVQSKSDIGHDRSASARAPASEVQWFSDMRRRRCG
jgi:hypothetical protein